MSEKLICQICEDEEAVGVACMPSVPISFAYGRKCIDANAHPYWALVANTALGGGLKNTADWWKWMVTDTCNYLGKTLEEFNEEVERYIVQLGEY